MKDHCARVQFQWIHGACHWAKEDPWKYCYSFSSPTKLISIAVEWLVKQREATSRRAPAVEVNIPVRDKVKMKIVDNVEVEKKLQV